MSTTRDFLSQRIAVLKTDGATNGNEMSRLGKERKRIFAELAEAEAAYAAIEALSADAQTDTEGDPT